MQSIGRSHALLLTATAGAAAYFTLAAWLNSEPVPLRPPSPPGHSVLRLWPPFEKHGFAAITNRQLSALASVADREDIEDDSRSPVVVYEDLHPLGPPHSNFVDISKLGAGRFAHWQHRGIAFSASDNSDPNVNGRRYWAVVP